MRLPISLFPSPSESSTPTLRRQTPHPHVVLPTKERAVSTQTLTPAAIVEKLDAVIVAQSAAKQALAAALWWNQHRRQLIEKGHSPASLPAKQCVMLLGPSGSGKSALARAAADLLKVPVFFTPATSYSIPGLVGLDPDDMIAGLVAAADGKIEAAETGIVVVDEVDKLRRRDFGGQADVGGESIQQGMLSLLEGCDSYPKIRPGERAKVRTDHITFVSTGAFVDLPAPSGPVSADTLIHYGFIPEFVSRFSLRIRMDDLSPADLKNILMTSQSSPTRQLANLFKIHGIELVFDDGALDAVIQSAIEDGVGARALNQVLWERTNNLIGQLPQLAAEGIVKVIIDRDTITRGLPAWKIPGESLESTTARKKVIGQIIWSVIAQKQTATASEPGPAPARRRKKAK